ncbi:MAG: glycosyltransferase family 2 protein [Candidatus Wallbacteria bacterium]
MKLSICIPTYNRAEYLRKAVSSVLAYNGDEIELIVQDNCSIDNTSAVVKSIHDTRLKYYRNDVNIGAIKNVIDIIKKANGEYVFLLTDDDYLLPGAIEEVLKFINQNDIYFFRTDLLIYLCNQKKTYYRSYIDSSLVFNFDNDKKLLFNNLFFSCHVLTGLCFKKNIIDFNMLNNFENNWYPQMSLAAQFYFNKKNVGYLAEPIAMHIWENETYWGINNDSQEILCKSMFDIILEYKRYLSYDKLKKMIYYFTFDNKHLPYKLDELKFIDKCILKIKFHFYMFLNGINYYARKIYNKIISFIDMVK